MEIDSPAGYHSIFLLESDLMYQPEVKAGIAGFFASVKNKISLVYILLGNG